MTPWPLDEHHFSNSIKGMDVDRGIMEEQYQKGIRQWRWWWSDRCYARARLLQSLRCSYNHIMLFV